VLDFHWFLPTYGDSRDIVGGGHGLPAGAAGGDRPATLDYLTQVSTAAEQMGFQGALVPTGAWCEDAWVTTAMLVQSTRRLKFLSAFRPGLMSPTLSAQMAATFQWQSQGRLLLNVVTGGEAHEQRAFGDFLDKDARYERCDEFLTIVRRLWEGSGPVSFGGRHLSVEEATLQRRPDPTPPLYFGGSSPAAGPVAARHADVYLTWGEPVPAVAEKLAWIRRIAKDVRRPMRFGIRLHVISRDTSQAAWAEAQRLLDRLDPQTVARVQANLRRSESEGQRRMLDLHHGSSDGLIVAPNLWAGVGLGRGGAGTALVGSHLEVADRIEEYADLGISEFVLSGYPHLEEAYWFGEGVLPLLRQRGLWSHPDQQATGRRSVEGAERAEGPEGADGMVPFAVA
jgi:alkanesulfonate monooxygenase